MSVSAGIVEDADLVLDLGAVLDDTVTALLSADPDAGEERHQVADTDVVERADGILDLGCQVAVNAADHELVELAYLLVPGERV